MSFLNKKVVFKPLASLRGQATVEYILLLVVVMLIAFGIGGPLGRHLKAFSGAMVGPEGYYACLTQEGLLPGDTSASNCAAHSNLALGHLGDISSGEAFNESTGLGAGNNFSGNNSDKGNSNKDSVAEDSKKSKNKASSKHRAKNTGSSSGNENSGATGSGQASSGDFLNRQDAFLASLNEIKDKKKRTNKKKRFRRKSKGTSVEDPFKNNKKTKTKSSRSRVSQGEGYLGDQNYFEPEEEEKQRVFKVTSENKKTNKGTNKEEKDKSRIQDRKPTGDGNLNDENRGMDFSGFLKYLIIAIMIIALVVVIFSQVMEYQNRD